MRTLVGSAALLLQPILAFFQSREEQANTSQDLLGHMEPSWFQHRFVFNMKLVTLRFARTAAPSFAESRPVSAVRTSLVYRVLHDRSDGDPGAIRTRDPQLRRLFGESLNRLILIRYSKNLIRSRHAMR
jgi:hypothetical protein